MSSARHKAPVERSARRRIRRLAVPALAATAITGSVVGVAVGAVGGGAPAPEPAAASAGQSLGRVVVAQDRLEELEDRQQNVSRSARRVTLEEKPTAVGHRYTTVALKVRTDPRENSRSVSVINARDKVWITGENRHGFAGVLYDGKAYWVTADYLVRTRPKPEPKPEPEPKPKSTSTSSSTTSSRTAAPDSAGSTSSAEPAGTCTATPPSGVVPGAMTVFEAVCSRFPSITTYGGWRGDGEHVDGHAIDIMISGDAGWAVADYLRANAAALNLYDVIYAQHIYTQERSSEGWRAMEDRGSTTANHYDHVHVAVY